MPFGHISSHSQMHYTENYTLAWAALRGDALTRRYVYILPYFYFIWLSCCRQFRSAIHFVHHLPFVNPAHASPSIVNHEGDHVLVANSQQRCQTAVFLTTGIVSLCELITPGCYSWYRLPPYVYLIRRTGTFIFLNNNLATPLFPNGTPLFHIRYKHLCSYLWLAFIPIYMTPSLYLHTTRLYPLIRTSIVLCSISTPLYLPVEP